MACSKSCKSVTDFFGNVPDIAIAKILGKLPIRMAAKTSVLSKQWRRAWLSIERLRFYSDFQEPEQNNTDTGSCNWQETSCIISSILLHHNGPVRCFDLYVSDDADGDCMNLSQWISFLSKNGVQKIRISNTDSDVYIPSYIFCCSELVHLELTNFSLNPPPTCFHGFPKLEHLELLGVHFTKQNIFRSLIENCRMLVTLKIDDCSGMDHVVIDAPSLQTLIIKGEFESLEFRNVSGLKSISIYLRSMPENLTTETVEAVGLLATSCQLQSIHFDGIFCKFLAAGGIIRSTSVTFKHLDKLCLAILNSYDFSDFSFLLSMIECCPYIKTLKIVVLPVGNVVPHVVDFNYNYKLDLLREVNIQGITGLSAELKLVEYLLAISPSLDNMFFTPGNCDTDSELKMSRTLMTFPRASPKASLVCRESADIFYFGYL